MKGCRRLLVTPVVVTGRSMRAGLPSHQQFDAGISKRRSSDYRNASKNQGFLHSLRANYKLVVGGAASSGKRKHMSASQQVRQSYDTEGGIRKPADVESAPWAVDPKSLGTSRRSGVASNISTASFPIPKLGNDPVDKVLMDLLPIARKWDQEDKVGVVPQSLHRFLKSSTRLSRGRSCGIAVEGGIGSVCSFATWREAAVEGDENIDRWQWSRRASAPEVGWAIQKMSKLGGNGVMLLGVGKHTLMASLRCIASLEMVRTCPGLAEALIVAVSEIFFDLSLEEKMAALRLLRSIVLSANNNNDTSGGGSGESTSLWTFPSSLSITTTTTTTAAVSVADVAPQLVDKIWHCTPEIIQSLKRHGAFLDAADWLYLARWYNGGFMPDEGLPNAVSTSRSASKYLFLRYTLGLDDALSSAVGDKKRNGDDDGGMVPPPPPPPPPPSALHTRPLDERRGRMDCGDATTRGPSPSLPPTAVVTPTMSTTTVASSVNSSWSRSTSSISIGTIIREVYHASLMINSSSERSERMRGRRAMADRMSWTLLATALEAVHELLLTAVTDVSALHKCTEEWHREYTACLCRAQHLREESTTTRTASSASQNTQKKAQKKKGKRPQSDIKYPSPPTKVSVAATIVRSKEAMLWATEALRSFCEASAAMARGGQQDSNHHNNDPPLPSPPPRSCVRLSYDRCLTSLFLSPEDIVSDLLATLNNAHQYGIIGGAKDDADNKDSGVVMRMLCSSSSSTTTTSSSGSSETTTPSYSTFIPNDHSITVSNRRPVSEEDASTTKKWGSALRASTNVLQQWTLAASEFTRALRDAQQLVESAQGVQQQQPQTATLEDLTPSASSSPTRNDIRPPHQALPLKLQPSSGNQGNIVVVDDFVEE